MFHYFRKKMFQGTKYFNTPIFYTVYGDEVLQSPEGYSQIL